MRFANDRRPGFALFEFALAAALIGWTGYANAQDDGQEKFKLVPPAPRTGQSGKASTPKKTIRVDQIPAPELRATQIPVNPTDPIIIINDQVITRQQLADECVARKGKEIAELMINRTLVEQALRAKKLEVTAAEIDQEIDSVAGRFGIGRENWLRTLDKERGISPFSTPGTSSTRPSRCGNCARAGSRSRPRTCRKPSRHNMARRSAAA